MEHSLYKVLKNGYVHFNAGQPLYPITLQVSKDPIGAAMAISIEEAQKLLKELKEVLDEIKN